MSIRYKFDVLSALKKQGYSQTRIRNEQLIGQATLTQLRHGELTSWRTINMICKLLDIQPGDLLEYVPDEELPVTFVSKEESTFAKAMAAMDERRAEDHKRMLLASANYKGVEIIRRPKKEHPFEVALQDERHADSVKPVDPAQVEALENAATKDTAPTAEATNMEPLP